MSHTKNQAVRKENDVLMRKVREDRRWVTNSQKERDDVRRVAYLDGEDDKRGDVEGQTERQTERDQRAEKAAQHVIIVDVRDRARNRKWVIHRLDARF